MVCDCIDSRTSLFTSLQDSCDTPRALRCFFVFTSSPCSSRWCLALFLYSSTFLAHVCLTPNHPSFLEVREFKGGWVVSCFYAQRYWYSGFIPALHLDNTQSFQTKPFFWSTCTCLVVLRERLSEQYVTFTAARHVRAQVGNTRSAFNTCLFSICLKIFKQSFGP